MESISHHVAFPVSLAIAFLTGFGAKQIGLPPLVGYLVTGFVLHAMGIRADEVIEELAELGVTLLLFSIGLHLKLRSLGRPEIWAGTTLHMVATVALFGVIFVGLSAVGLALFAELDLTTAALIAFALSFSSTVFAVKTLEEKGEAAALHGRTAIGILVMQDVIAVLFLTFSTGKVPSPWAFALVGLLALRPVLGFLMDRIGRGELVPLFGLFAALSLGVTLFQMVGMKPDLGALIFGMLLASHPRAKDVGHALFAFKEIFLVGFFLTIGLRGFPTPTGLGIAALLAVLVPLKVALLFWLLTRFRLRARSALLSSLSLANYSEFGLIVGGVGVANGWIGAEWLVVIAIALSISFVISAPVNKAAHSLYARHRDRLVPFERDERHPDDQPIDTGDAQIAVFGMGRIGSGAYDEARERYGDVVIGIDSDAEEVARQQAAGRNVIHGDASDSDFWERVDRHSDDVKVVLLAMPDHDANLYALEQIPKREGQLVAALADYPEQVEALLAAGADEAFDLYAEAGARMSRRMEPRVDELTGYRPPPTA